MNSIAQAKQILRQKSRLLRIRNDPFHEWNNGKLSQNLFGFIRRSCIEKQVIAAFWPLENEPDLRNLLRDLHRAGYRIALPETPAKGKELRFRLWYPEVVLHKGRYGTLYPETERVRPDCILVPLLSFDRAGRRLGYGGGYYDRTLCQYPKARAVGVAFSYQETPVVPTEEFDQFLPVIVTESEIIYRNRE